MGSRRRLILVSGVVALWAQTAAAQLHHVHLNSTDPDAAVRFYSTKFAAEASMYAGKPAVRAQESWLLFDKVKAAPLDNAESPIWHIGWGAEDMPAAYEQQLAAGTKFHTPLTDISDLANVPGFYYAYVDGPDHALIELNTAAHHNFGHLHLFSADPIAAAEWYGRLLGVKVRVPRSREVRMYRGFQVGPSASFTIANVNVILFPAGYRGHQRFRSTRGTVFDHVAFRVDQLEGALRRVAGVKVLQEAQRIRGTGERSVMVEGPDLIAIELVQ
jgi:catechol 2,3-dioxygenase-like lactoylglutathione lyase family enzyme